METNLNYNKIWPGSGEAVCIKRWAIARFDLQKLKKNIFFTFIRFETI